MRTALELTSCVTARVKGRSMLPFYPPGMRILVRAPREGERLLGRVIVFERRGVLVSHRVVVDRGASLRCRGDANGHFEELSRSDVVGVVCRRRGSARVLDWVPSEAEHRLARGYRRFRRAGSRVRRIFLDRAAG